MMNYRQNKILEFFIGFAFIIIGLIDYSRQFLGVITSLWGWLWIFAGVFMLVPFIYENDIRTLIRAFFLILIGLYFVVAELFNFKFNRALPVLLTIIIIVFYIYFFETQIKHFLLIANLMIFIFFILIIITFLENKYWCIAFIILGIYMIIKNVVIIKKTKKINN